jgi:hypothetical protein
VAQPAVDISADSFCRDVIGLDQNHMAMAYDGNERVFLPLGLNLKAA